VWVEHQPEKSGVPLDTPFSRLKSSWAKVNPEGFLVQGTWIGTWSPQGDKIEFSRVGKDPQCLGLEDYRQHVTHLVPQLQACLIGLLPEQMPLPQIPPQTLVDHSLRSESFLDSFQSQSFFLPLFKEFEERMHSSFGGLAGVNGSTTNYLAIEKLKAWLEQEHQFQKLLLATLLATGGGIPPRHLTIEDCRIRRTQYAERNIFIMGGDLTWAWGKEKGVGPKQGSLWSYPPQVACLVYYYLGVIRPFTIKALQNLGRNTLRLEQYLFARSDGPDQTWYYSYTKSSIKDHLSQPLKLTINIHDLRQLGQAIRNRHFPLVPKRSGLSIINQMGNHGDRTSDKNYGQDETSNISLQSQSRLDITDMLSASRAYHSWLGFVLAESSQEGGVAIPTIERSAENHHIAFLYAQSLIPRLYNINCQDPVESKRQAEEILTTMKFLHRGKGEVSVNNI